ncbi:hypothetical protein Aperf_G00000074249 [Anoplocephala perfoliata]
MRAVLCVVLFFEVAFCAPLGYFDCDRHCAYNYEIAPLIDACIKGCSSSVGLEAKTDEFGVNLNCETSCGNFTDDALKSACYDGCTNIPPAKIESPSHGMPLREILSSPIFLRIFSLFKFFEKIEPINASDLGETHVRIVIPEGPGEGPHTMDGEDMRIMVNVIHGPDVELPGAAHVIQLSPGDDDAVDVPNSARKICLRARAAFHYIFANSLLIFSFVCLFLLIIIAFLRIRDRRARKAIVQRQYRRMPAFFKSPSMRVNLLTPQPPSDDEVPELPHKKPIV